MDGWDEQFVVRRTVYLCVYVFIFIRVTKDLVSWSAADEDFFLLKFLRFFGFMDYKNWWLWKPKNQQTIQFCCRKAKKSCFGPKTLTFSIFVANLHICVLRIEFWENLLMSTSRRLCNHDIHNCVFVIDLMKRVYRLGICQKNYTTQFLGERILHTENALIETIFASNKQQKCIIISNLALFWLKLNKISKFFNTYEESLH